MSSQQNHDLTQLNKAFLKLCCSIGILNGKAPENITSGNFDMVTTDAHEVFNLANALFSKQLNSDRAFKQALFDSVPVASEVSSHE